MQNLSRGNFERERAKGATTVKVSSMRLTELYQKSQ